MENVTSETQPTKDGNSNNLDNDDMVNDAIAKAGLGMDAEVIQENGRIFSQVE